MQLVGGQTAQRIDHIFVRDLERLVDGLTLDHLGGDRARGDRAAAAKGLKLHIVNFVVFDFQIHLHDIAALGVADLTDAVRVFDLADVARVHEVIHHSFRIKSHCRILLCGLML